MIHHKNILLPPACISKNKTKFYLAAGRAGTATNYSLLATYYTVWTAPQYLPYQKLPPPRKLATSHTG